MPLGGLKKFSPPNQNKRLYYKRLELVNTLNSTTSTIKRAFLSSLHILKVPSSRLSTAILILIALTLTTALLPLEDIALSIPKDKDKIAKPTREQ